MTARLVQALAGLAALCAAAAPASAFPTTLRPLTFECFKNQKETVAACTKRFMKDVKEAGCQSSAPQCRDVTTKYTKKQVCTVASTNCSARPPGKDCAPGESTLALVGGCKHFAGAQSVPASPPGPDVTFVCSSSMTATRDCFNQMTSYLASKKCKVSAAGCRKNREPDQSQWCEAKSSNCRTPGDGDCGSGKQVGTSGDRTLCRR